MSEPINHREVMLEESPNPGDAYVLTLQTAEGFGVLARVSCEELDGADPGGVLQRKLELSLRTIQRWRREGREAHPRWLD